VTLTRRQLLLGGAGIGAAGVAGGVWRFGPERLYDELVPPHGVLPTGSPGPVTEGAFRSTARGRVVRWAVAWPPGSRPGDPLPLVLTLHGRGEDSHAAFGAHALHRFLGDAVRAGSPSFALAAVDGGDHSYWHPRADGDDPQAMVLEELLPVLARQGLRTERFGLLGWSMGGYGALLLASEFPARASAVAVDAPALWHGYADSAPGSFDDAADFTRYDVLGRPARLRGLPLRVACGRSDPFISTSRALAAALPDADSDFPRGGHDLGCWNTLRLGDLRFLGRHVAS
jgi:enterochelin esterase-like enzyme